MSGLSIGLSSLTAHQRALDITGQNIANANTPGYHRQVARLAARLPQELQQFQIGTGVEVTDIHRLRNSLLENLLTRQTFELGDTTAQVQTLRQIEVLIGPGEGSVYNRLEAFFNSLTELTGRPDDVTQRRVVLGSAAALGDQLNALAGEFDRVRQRLDANLSSVVSEINQLAPKIAELNGEIQRAEVRGIDANDLRDQRDQLINELAQRVGVRIVEQDFGQSAVFVSGLPLVLGNRSLELAVTTDQQGSVVVTRVGSTDPILIPGGELGGLLAVRNQVVPDLRNRLDLLAGELIRRLDSVQATGLGLPLTLPSPLGGEGRVRGLTFLSGHRAVNDVTVPLSQAQSAFPVQAGSLFITVTDLATGQRTLTEVAIDPATQSLQDVAATISAVGNLQAIADAQTQTLQIMVQNGFAFDFAGRLQSSPDTSGITGTTTPTIGGVYSGDDNDVFNFRVIGSGTVGVTAGLTLEVRDAGGTVIASLDIGQGYEPGSDLEVADDVSVRLSSGTANTGDTFSVQVVADPDTADILSALGLNTFFSGQDAASIQVQPDLLSQPGRLSASRSGQPGDASNLRRMTALRDTLVLAGGTQTFREFYASIVGDVATKVQELSQLKDHQELVGQRLEAERQSISGVDPNEELVRLLQLQRSFQIAARYISVVNETLDELLLLVG